MSQWYDFVISFLDFDSCVHTRFIGPAYSLLFQLKSNTLCMKLGSSYDHFLQVKLLVIVLCTNNCWDLETTSTYGNILFIPNLLYLSTVRFAP